MIKFENVFFKYPKFEIKDLNFEINAGEIVAIVGNNASGKTTILNLAAGLLKPKKGKILVDGKKPVCGKQIGMVFQNPDNQIIFSKVKDDIAFTLKNHKVPKSEWDSRISEALKLVHLENFEERDTNELSAGQKQRLVIANMLATKPQILLLDEVSVYLDPTAKQDLFKLLLELKDSGITIVFATNILDEIVFADKVIVMDNGKVVKFADKKDIIKDLKIFKDLNILVPVKLNLLNLLGCYDLKFDDEILEEISRRK